ncbi:hypothetical protein [Pseudomonas auratipiscis]|uniref:Acetyltransferase n=1 Tax=Pseudomonas auratipiscis TaxID=3115853 RepID=A0AB35WKP0_9PSED|nr:MULTISPECIES: hypothetical protein [unclassified Pseudomonas]MEE1864805.1 hypothetical protein [Pseudomonas sp. 120P]MEE1956254.1 hypothetical protein [Pseudomonas sp. 119P]
MPPTIRVAHDQDAHLFAVLERSAAQAFTAYEGLQWLASGDELNASQHQTFIGNGHACVVVDEHSLGVFLQQRLAAEQRHGLNDRCAKRLNLQR